jgi:hypothetical protein
VQAHEQLVLQRRARQYGGRQQPLHQVADAQLADARGVERQRQRARALHLPYGDEKVANRDIRIWHLVIENGY